MGPCNKNQYCQRLESVQRRATKFCCNIYHRTSSVALIPQELVCEDLQSRRDQNKATLMYRIVNNLIEIPAGQYLTATGVATRGHHQRYLPIYCSINAYKGPVFPPTVHLCRCRYHKIVIVNNVLIDFNCT